MKKFLIIIISLFIVCGISLCLIFSWNSSDSTNEQIVTLTKIVLQSIISGSVTFLGLFITISFNERQIKLKELIEKRPRLYFKPIGNASDKRERNKFSGIEPFYCPISKVIRTIECEIHNSKKCIVNDIRLKRFFICSDEMKCFTKYELALSNNKIIYRKFFVIYEDIMGNKYKQKIKYKYIKNIKSYKFKSSEPKRRLL